MSAIRASCVLAVAAVWSSTALASPDLYGTGDGHEGELEVDAPGTVVNHASALGVDARAGDDFVDVTSVSSAAGSFAAGDLVLFWQHTGLAQPALAGAQQPLALEAE